MSVETDFIARLVGVAPELQPDLDEHLVDQEGELLPYVFAYQVAQWLDGVASSDAERAKAVLVWLDDEFVTGDSGVRNLIDVGIIEMLPSVPEGEPVLALLPPALHERAAVAGLFLNPQR